MSEDVALPEVETQAQEPETQEPETQEPEAQEGQEPETQEPQRGKKSAQQRINEITKARYEAERLAAYWKGIAEGSRSQTQQVPESAARESAARPNLADFPDYETYIEALTDWKTTQKVAEVVHHQQAATVQERHLSHIYQQRWASRSGCCCHTSAISAGCNTGKTVRGIRECAFSGKRMKSPGKV